MLPEFHRFFVLLKDTTELFPFLKFSFSIPHKPVI